MARLYLFIILLLSTMLSANTIHIDDKTVKYDILKESQVYIDHTRKLTIQDILKKSPSFEKNDKSLLGYGYSPDFDVWIKFTLHNDTNKAVHKILEYGNVLTTDILFYNPSQNYQEQKDGLFNINKERKTIKPIFEIKLQPNETKTYYLKASSKITTLIIKLQLLSSKELYTKEIQYQLILALFFGAMFILAFYNLFIYFFTKDISYLFYVLYIIGIVVHHAMYVGFVHIYVQQEIITFIIKIASFIVGWPIFALALFTKTFLQTKQYPVFDKILNIFLVLLPISIIIFTITDVFSQYRNILSFCLIIYLMILAIYATFKHNRQAYFVLFGETIIAAAFTSLYLASTGIFNLYEYLPYFVELALVLEAIVFSIALADRINQLQKDKEEANKLLIKQQRDEQERLKIKVEEKTKDLKIALDEKGLLLKELNHRVKNNMQTIVSLIRLQSDELNDEKVSEIFLTVQNRINAMSHLHELLYKQENISYINAYEYFEIVIDELKYTYDNDVVITYDIKTQLKMEQAIYCGLILNELITNSFKYAFPNNEGNIHVSLSKDENEITLIVSDDGIGFDKKSLSNNTLGMMLVNTLATSQLKGNIESKTNKGVEVMIKWNNDE